MVAWATNPPTPFVDGVTVDEDDLNAVLAYVTELRAAIDGTSANITTFSGSGVGAGTTTPKATRRADIVYLSGNITDSNSVLANGSIATLPAGYWPAAGGSWTCAGDNTNWGRISISTAGVLTFVAMGGTSATTIDLSVISFVGA